MEQVETKVDVLAVLADYSAQHGDPEDFEQARAAVAELIDKYKEMLGVITKQASLLESGCRDIPCPRPEARDTYYAALARVGGGK